MLSNFTFLHFLVAYMKAHKHRKIVFLCKKVSGKKSI